MRIIVIGAGEVGSYVAERLSREGNDVVVVEIDAEKLRAVDERLDVLTVLGSGTHPKTLERAGLKQADLMVAVTSRDEVNLVACQLATQAGVPRTVARIESSNLRGRDAAELRSAIGIDLVIDPDQETATEILELLEYPGATDIAVMGGGDVIVIGTDLKSDAPLVGERLSEIAARYEPEWDFLVATITRGEETIIPRGDQTLQAGDVLRVLCRRRFRREMMKMLGLAPHQHRRVMLLGGGRTAEIVAELMASRHGVVTLVERDMDRARELAERLEGVLVLEGDITDVELLDSEEVGTYDAVIALTGQDDANILSCLYAKSRGASEAIAVLHRLSLRPLLRDVGIDAALSPRTASANGVLRFVRGGVAQVATFLSADFEIIELEVREGSPAAGSLIAELRLPKNVLIGAVVRDGKAQIGRGRSELRERDHVVVFAEPEALDEVRRIFG